jgi:hypothetical protein
MKKRGYQLGFWRRISGEGGQVTSIGKLPMISGRWRVYDGVRLDEMEAMV